MTESEIRSEITRVRLVLASFDEELEAAQAAIHARSEPHYQKLVDLEEKLYEKLLSDLESDDTKDLDKAYARFEEFLDLETLHDIQDCVVHLDPLDVTRVFSFDRGQDVILQNTFAHFLEEYGIERVQKSYRVSEDAAKEMAVKTIHAAIKEKLTEFSFVW